MLSDFQKEQTDRVLELLKETRNTLDKLETDTYSNEEQEIMHTVNYLNLLMTKIQTGKILV